MICTFHRLLCTCTNSSILQEHKAQKEIDYTHLRDHMAGTYIYTQANIASFVCNLLKFLKTGDMYVYAFVMYVYRIDMYVYVQFCHDGQQWSLTFLDPVTSNTFLQKILIFTSWQQILHMLETLIFHCTHVGEVDGVYILQIFMETYLGAEKQTSTRVICTFPALLSSQ